jgi:predicted transcriptional regulator
VATVTVGVGTRAQVRERLSGAFAGRSQGGPRLTFASHALMWRVLTPNRWVVLETMTGAGPLALREVARRVGRDVKGVHTDVHALLGAGVLNRTESGAFEFPYEAVHVDFTLRAAA